MTATTSLAQALSAQDIIRHYDLMPHVEGGHYRRVWCSSQDLQPESLPCGIYGSRPCSTSILYLLQAGERSRLHRIRQDELWHFHLGGPLRLYCLTPDGKELDRILGADILAGQHLLLPMPGGCWFGAEPCPGTDFSLVSCTVAPGFDFRDFELAKAAGKATGNVTTAEIQDATPAVLESHSSERACYGPQGKTDGTSNNASKQCLINQLKENGGIGSISEQLLDTRADVTIGGGSKYFRQTVQGGECAGKTVWEQAKEMGYQTVENDPAAIAMIVKTAKISR